MSVDSSALDLLRKALSSSASVNLPGDPGYSNKRWALNAEKPAAIVACPVTAEDVVHILAFAQGKAPYEVQPAIPLAVKGGGHSPSGASSCENGLVIDLQPNMHDVRVDPEAKVAYVAGGCLWQDVDEATIQHGLASVAGIVGHTGVGGLTLGGGFGWLVGQHGLVIDNLVEVTIVTSSGDILQASDSENTDLFWAVRGGGGNFGVVTEFVLKLHDQRPNLYSNRLVFPPSALESIVPEVNAWLAEREPTENGHLVFVNIPNGQPSVVLKLVFNGDSETGAKKFERFVKLGPVMNQTETIPYTKLNHLLDQSGEYGSYRLFHGNFVPCTPTGLPVTLVKDLFAGWLKLITESPAASRLMTGFELYGTGKWSSIPGDATAFPNRAPAYNVPYVMTWSDPAFTPNAANEIFALDRVFTQSRNSFFQSELVSQGGYANYFDEESRLARKSQEFAHRRFGANFPRLIEIKGKYDPGNIFGRWFATPREGMNEEEVSGATNQRLVH